jgi:outer membrane protein OmpA-like peptidoglycan-associated protein
MSSSAVARGRVALAALIIGATPAVAQQAQLSNEPGVVTVQPARVPVPGSPEAAARNASLRPPPPGPIESRLLPIPESSQRPPRDARSAPPAAAYAAPGAVESPGPSTSGPISGPIFANPPVRSLAAPIGSAMAASRPPEPAPSTPGAPLAVIGFAGQSANLTEATRAELDRVAKVITEKGVRQIELRGYAFGGLDSRKVALARALVVRAYLIDAKIKARVEVGTFEGEGSHVEILGPKT